MEFEIQDVNFTPYMLDSIVHLMVWDNDFLSRCSVLLKPKFFADERKVVVDMCYSHFEKYKQAPEKYIFDIVQEYTRKKPSQRKILQKYLDKLSGLQPNKGYVLSVFGEFIRSEICKSAIERGKAILDKGNIKQAEEAVISGFREASMAITPVISDILVEKNFNLDDCVLEPNIKTFVDSYDRITGGWHRKEMVLLVGDYSVGKTFMVNHIGKVSVIQGKKVLQVTLETPKEEILARYAAAFTASKVKSDQHGSEGGDTKDFSFSKLKKKLDFLRKRGGKLWVYQGLSFGFEDLVALVNNIEVLEGVVPDVILLDSPDQMVKPSLYRDEWANERELYRKLLEFTKERNITLVVTAWSNRPTSDKRMTKGHHIGGSIGKIQIVDTGITLSQSEAEAERGVLIWFQVRSRGAKKYIMVEIKQNLEIGQAVISSRLIKDRDAIKNLQEAHDLVENKYSSQEGERQ